MFIANGENEVTWINVLAMDGGRKVFNRLKTVDAVVATTVAPAEDVPAEEVAAKAAPAETAPAETAPAETAPAE
ncbi:MAG: hypothetical protein WCF12_08950, partial [Propionicimonas sp.]